MQILVVIDTPRFHITTGHVRRWFLFSIRLDGFNEEDLSFWVDGEGRLSSLARLRDDLLRQDCRLLYLAWLKAVSLGEVDESEVEPPVPPGLCLLSSALRNFVDLVELAR